MDYQGNDFYCEQVLSGKVKPKIVKEDEACLAFYQQNHFSQYI